MSGTPKVHFNGAVLHGKVNPGGQELEECLFEYGETEAYGQTIACRETPAEIGSGNSAVTVEVEVTGLKRNSEYHFRLVAKSGTGASRGEDESFVTPEGPVWNLTVTPNADFVLPGVHPGVYKVVAENVGDEPTSSTEAVTIENIVPPGTTAEASRLFYSALNYANLAEVEMCPTANTCIWPSGPAGGSLPKAVRPGQRLIMMTRIGVPGGMEGDLEDLTRISGGGLPPAEAGATNTASANPPFGDFNFESFVTDASKTTPYVQAGGHPYQFVTEFNFGTFSTSGDFSQWEVFGRSPVGDPKETIGELPPGLIINPQGVPHCSLADYFSEACERSTAVGSSGIQSGTSEAAFSFFEPVFNLQPEGAYPGQLGITVGGAPFIVVTSGIRDGSDYGVTARNVATQLEVTRVRLILWGVPAEAAHDAVRGATCQDVSFSLWAPKFMSPSEIEQACNEKIGFLDPRQGGPAEVPLTPFITMPTECSGEPLTVRGRYNTWQNPGQYATDNAQLEPVEGCSALNFEPTIEARPTTNLADAPSGLDFHIHLPQNEDPEGVATPQLRESVVKLPEGLSLNPSSAEGLLGCTEAEVALHAEEASHCPNASKLGSAEVNTPLLKEPLKGWIYLATPEKNPFGSLLASYISLEGQGIRIKLPGEFETDPQSGQITSRFPQNPQLPFEDLRLHFFEGARGFIRTPATCGSYRTTSALTPFSAPESGPPATPAATFTTTAAENGGSCPTSASQLPSSPLLRAGTERPQAGIYSPFSLRLVRQDGSQELSSFNVGLPPGLTARLAGIPYCPDSAISHAAAETGAEEQAAPSCPVASQVGTVDIASGAGPTPIHVPGKVYLAGPYKGAPLSLAFITPVLAGPFNMGTTVVRAAVYLDPETVQNHVVSDQLPTILQGIPLDIRSITVNLGRSKFMLNPTSCKEFHFAGNATSTLEATTLLSERFQVGDCAALRFKPMLRLSFSGGVHRNGHPRLRAVVTPTPGGANLSSTQVTLPLTELVDNSHLRDVCSKVQFEANECPESSIYGHARAETPLLSQPLEGPVFLQPNTHRLPDLVAALHSGPFAINVHLHARQDSVDERIRTTFENIPDVPLTRFVLNMDGGKKGLLVNSTDLCARRRHFDVRMRGQNGKAFETKPLLRVACGGHRARKTAKAPTQGTK